MGDVRVRGPEQCPQGRVHRLEACIRNSKQQTYSSSGDGGLDELTEDFNPSKIQYAFLKVEDPKTSLPKFVLINWQVSECTILLSAIHLKYFRVNQLQAQEKALVRCIFVILVRDFTKLTSNVNNQR